MQIFILSVLLFVFTVLPVLSEDKSYLGSEACKKCHEDIYNRFTDSGHPFKLRKSDIGKVVGFPLPKGYTWDDISYVIGGKTKKIRYIDNNGFIITADKEGKPIPTQYNIATGKWANYFPGEKKPYKCGPCHMTAYSEQGNQNGKSGLIGTWVMDSIQCEECHGPASMHVADPKTNKPKIDKESSACGKCHIRGEAAKIPAKDGFIEHHEQYNELLMGGHQKQKCVDCHDPHAKIKAGIKKDCAACHKEIADKYLQQNIHGKSHIACIECHMPYVGKSAESYDNYIGDVRTHLFRIKTDENYVMFSEDGKFVKSELSIDYACLSCHQSRDKKWASSYIVHEKKTPESKSPESKSPESAPVGQ